MRILYIIGNGFDISLGMKTGYPDFYQYYLSQPSKDDDIINLKNSIKDNKYETWADLEIGLGKYTSSISSQEVFLKCLEDIRANLKVFLEKQFANRSYSPDPRKFVECFTAPGSFLDAQIELKYDLFLRTLEVSNASKKEVSIISLNYTNTIEDIMQGSNSGIQILHLHGTLDNGIVVGVNDLEQIENQSFRSDIDVKESFVKPEYNDSCLNDNNLKAKYYIDRADVIVFFGASLGESDKKWWRMIGGRLLDPQQSVLLVYFPYDKKKDVSAHPNYRRRWNNEYFVKLLNALEIPDERKADVEDRICIGLNKPLFKLNRRTNLPSPPRAR